MSACWAVTTAATCFPKKWARPKDSLSVFFNVPSAKIKFHFHRTTQTENKIKLSSSVSFSPMVRSHSGHWLCTEIGYEQLLGSALPGV